MIKKILLGLILIGSTLFLLSNHANAQAVYSVNGTYLGYFQTSPNGVTTFYEPSGRVGGSYQIDNGQTNFYGSKGNYTGTITSPIYSVPNTTINTPRNVPQAPSIGGW